MTTQREALELAREALKAVLGPIFHQDDVTRALVAIDAALAAPDPTGYSYVDQLIASLLLPLPAMTEREVGVLHKNCADMLYMLSRKRQQPDPQPVAWLWLHNGNAVEVFLSKPDADNPYWADKGYTAAPLYAAPPDPAREISDERIYEIMFGILPLVLRDTPSRQALHLEFARAVLAAATKGEGK